MPTISQLPAAVEVTSADELPISQSGSACAVSVGSLLAGTQPAVLAPTGTLLGRTSFGSGGPEPVLIGTGLVLNDETLLATGADHAGFPLEETLTPSHRLVVSGDGGPRLLEVAMLRKLFSAGVNVSIDSEGTISATADASAAVAQGRIVDLPLVSTVSADNLLAISAGGVDHSISLADLIDGQIIDQAQAASAASDTDGFWVAQGGSSMVRQTLSGVWEWLRAKLQAYKRPTLEITIDTTLTDVLHNGRILVCSQPVTLSIDQAGLANGFVCDVINLSNRDVIFEPGIALSLGGSVLPVGQAATLTCVNYSAGMVVYARASTFPTPVTIPGQVTGLTIGATTDSSVALTWTLEPQATSGYLVQYRTSGSANWVATPTVTAPNCTLSGLMAATGYDVVVSAQNSAGVGVPSAIVSCVTSALLAPPGGIGGLSVVSVTSDAATLSWSPPSSGGIPSSFTVQYRLLGSIEWLTIESGLTSTSSTVTGLSPARSYEFRVSAANSAGTGIPSAAIVGTTMGGVDSVAAITWNVVPIGSYDRASGVIGVNAHVTPGTAAVQFGFSQSTTGAPGVWTSATHVNTDLWGAYVTIPGTPGTWYVWAEGIDGSLPTAYSVGFAVT